MKKAKRDGAPVLQWGPHWEYPLPANPQCDMVTKQAGGGYLCCAMTQGHCGPHVPIYALHVVWTPRAEADRARVAKDKVARVALRKARGATK